MVKWDELFDLSCERNGHEKMTIQWFPGHMAKAKREVAEKIKYVDIVFELVDARLPFSSKNPMLDQSIQQKPRCILMNKADLADARQSVLWQRFFQEQGMHTLLIDAQHQQPKAKIIAEAKQILQEKRAREQAKGLKPRAIRAMCVGIPNVGKSTLMNKLIGKKIAQTGNKPGVTKGQQWIKVGSEFELLDTPGILWPKFEDKEIGKKLALTGAIKDQLLHMDDLALEGLRFFARFYPEQLRERYRLTIEETFLAPVDLLLLISEKRGFKEDYARASEMIVHEIRNGKLGPFTLDRWEEMRMERDEA